MPSVFVVGASRGLGNAIAQYHASQPSTTVYGTIRKDTPPKDTKPNIQYLTNIDLLKPTCGTDITSQLPTSTQLTHVYIVAGIFQLESFDAPNWDLEIQTYTTSAIAPPTIISSLFKTDHLATKADPCTKIILISSEAGSLTLNQAGGGGNYAHHASKSALNMAGTMLRYDLEPSGIAVGMVHPSFMRTEMTKGVGFDVAWEENEALTPDEAARIICEWTDGEFGMEKTGQFWAPRGTRDIGAWKDVMGGEHVKGPVRLPW